MAINRKEAVMLKTRLRCSAASPRHARSAASPFALWASADRSPWKALIPAAIAAAMMTAVSAPASAHHSFVMFDKQKERTLTGTVTEFENTNPHAMIMLTTEDGRDWIIQTESPLVLEKVGINDSTLSEGEKVTVRVHPMKNGSPEGSLIELTTEDGMMMSLGTHAYGELMEQAAAEERAATTKN
jgi:hypothetical protein